MSGSELRQFTQSQSTVTLSSPPLFLRQTSFCRPSLKSARAFSRSRSLSVCSLVLVVTREHCAAGQVRPRDPH